MTPIKNETSEVERKLLELVNFYKQEPEKTSIREILECIRNSAKTSGSLKSCLENSNISARLVEFNTMKKHILILDLIYMCFVYNLYSENDASKIILKISSQSWELSFKIKILQMCFYLVRFDLSLELYFKLLDMILESFVIEDPSIDLISRPVVCQIIEKITKKNDNGKRDIFEFLFDVIVIKQRVSGSYILSMLLKCQDVEKLPGFSSFLKNRFIECCLLILKIGGNDDKISAFEAVLQVESDFSSFLALDSLYDQFYEIYKKDPKCHLLLKFISSLIQIRAAQMKFPFAPSLSFILLEYTRNTDFSQDPNKFLKFFIEIINSNKVELGLDELLCVTFDTIARSPLLSENGALLYFSSLSYCIKNDLRHLFEKGLISGYACRSQKEDNKAKIRIGKSELETYCDIGKIDEFVFDMREYMGVSWGIYLENNTEHNLERIKDFTHEQLESFIDALPAESDLALRLFESSPRHFKLEKIENTNCQLDLFKKLLLKVCSQKDIFTIILKFYLLNKELTANPEPLKTLLNYLKKIEVRAEETVVTCKIFNTLVCNLQHESIYGSVSDHEFPGGISKIIRLDDHDSPGRIIRLGDGNTDNSSDPPIKNEVYNELSESYNQIAEVKLQGSIVGEIYTLIDKLLKEADLDQCWNEIFDLLKLGYGHFDAKIGIILHINDFFLSKLGNQQLEAFLLCFIDLFIELCDLGRKTSGQGSVEVFYVRILKSFRAFLLHPKIAECVSIWRMAVLFATGMINRDIDLSVMPDIGQEPLGLFLIKSSYFLEMFFSFLRTAYERAEKSELDFLNKILFSILYDSKNKTVFLKALGHLSLFLKDHFPDISMNELIEFLAKKTCEDDEEVAITSFKTIRRISTKIRQEIDHVETLSENELAFGEAGKKLKIKEKYKKKMKSLQNGAKGRRNHGDGGFDALYKEKSLDFHGLNQTDEYDTHSNISDSSSKTDSRTKMAMGSRVFNLKAVNSLVDAFKSILLHCNSLRYSIISQVFSEIPLFRHNTLEISALSEHLKKYIEMPDPFRTNAVDCFIKTCGSSGHFSFALQVLSSWLSKNSKETSLSLISKIGENLQKEEPFKLMGLCNFLDYSQQFCRSNDFLEPVLNLIEQCDCVFESTTAEKLINFAKNFINGQMEVQYTVFREDVLIRHIGFITNVVTQEHILAGLSSPSIFLDFILGIISKKNRYFRMKLKSYKILFDCYDFSKEVLQEELKKTFVMLASTSLAQGTGMSSYSIIQLYHILQLLVAFNNLDLIAGLKEELTGLLIIRDYKVIDLVRLLLQSLFL